MRRIRGVMRLKHAHGLSERQIAASLALSKSSVGTYLHRARQAGLSWPLPEGLDDDVTCPPVVPGSQRGSTGLGLVVGPVVLGKRAGSGALKLLKRPARLERRLVAER